MKTDQLGVLDQNPLNFKKKVTKDLVEDGKNDKQINSF